MNPTERLSKIETVIDSMHQLVERDGGALQLADEGDPGVGVIEVSFKESPNEDCATCAFTSEMIRDFLIEGFRSHGLEVEDVKVATV